MTRTEFFKSDEMSKIRKNIITCAVSAYVIAALSLALNIFLLDNPSGIIDSILMVVLGLLIQLLQSLFIGADMQHAHRFLFGQLHGKIIQKQGFPRSRKSRKAGDGKRRRNASRSRQNLL